MRTFPAHHDDDRRDEGFTLLELIIAIAIIGILVAISLPVYGKIQQASRTTTVKDAGYTAYDTAIAAITDDDSTSVATTNIATMNARNNQVLITLTNQGGLENADANYVCVKASWRDTTKAVPTASYGLGCTT